MNSIRVYRLGSGNTGLSNKNAADLEGIAEVLVAGHYPGTLISIYNVSVSHDFGPYVQYQQGAPVFQRDATPYVGKSIDPGSLFHGTWYSFPKESEGHGWKAYHLRDVARDKLDHLTLDLKLNGVDWIKGTLKPAENFAQIKTATDQLMVVKKALGEAGKKQGSLSDQEIFTQPSRKRVGLSGSDMQRLKQDQQENEAMMTESDRMARYMVNRVTQTGDAPGVLREMLAAEDELAGVIGLPYSQAKSKLSDLGFQEQGEISKEFPSGSVHVFTAPNPENPGEMARVYVAVGDDGAVKVCQNDAVPNRDPEAIDSTMNNMATQLGLVRPAGSTAQPGDGGVGYIPGAH